jgi:2-polyprenyl-6-methoxyphenol hydroxylase-like FAD-dependent oxidoreductase
MDVVIIGGGLSGTLTAVLLGRSGLRVALVDLHQNYPPDFRAEQLVGAQVEMLRQLGLLDILVRDVVPAERAVSVRAGRIVGVTTATHYGIRYEDLVNRARQHLPSSVRFIKAMVVDIEATADIQRVRLSNGDLVEGRLVVLATGFGQRLLRKLGIDRTAIRDAHSLTFGFDLQVESPAMFRSSVLVAYGEQAADGIDYLAIFSIANKLRANLFAYGNRQDCWTQSMVQQPREMLLKAMPRLEQIAGEIKILGSVQHRVNDLAVASGYRRDGVVLIGDAFQTSCPAAGTGIGRLLNDIDRLCNFHIPKWLATDRMDAEKISEFYDDPLKANCDAEAMRIADYRRSFTTKTGLLWKIHRRRVALHNQLRVLTKRKGVPQFKGAWAAPRS